MPISDELEKIIENRKVINGSEKNIVIIKNHSINEHDKIIVPIISDSEVVGSIILCVKELSQKIDDSKLEIAKVASLFLGMQLEI